MPWILAWTSSWMSASASCSPWLRQGDYLGKLSLRKRHRHELAMDPGVDLDMHIGIGIEFATGFVTVFASGSLGSKAV